MGHRSALSIDGLQRQATGLQGKEWQAYIRSTLYCIFSETPWLVMSISVCVLSDDPAKAAAEGEGAAGDPVSRSRPAKEPKHNTSPSATLESSLEALNVKKFDLTFAMDPLFRRTSAQFDEGGAKGKISSACMASLVSDTGGDRFGQYRRVYLSWKLRSTLEGTGKLNVVKKKVDSLWGAGELF